MFKLSSQNVKPLEQSVKKVPFSSGASSTQNKQQAPSLILQEFKVLCQAIFQQLNRNQLLDLKEKFIRFENLLSENIQQLHFDLTKLKLIVKEDQNKISKIKQENADLKEKIKKLTFSIAQSPIILSPMNERSSNYSIDLISQFPLRNTSHSFQFERIPLREINNNNNTIY